MNIDLLKKLTRLANNNPNDNEANLAARKVCKMLEEGNWSLNNTPPPPPKAPFRPTYEESIFNEMFRRAREDAERYRKQEEQYNRDQAEQDRKRREAQKERETPFREKGPFTGTGSWFNARHDYWDPVKVKENPFTGEGGPKSNAYTKKEKRPLECTRCHKKQETGYVGNLYVCTTCVWEEYMKQRGP